jgi:hypothetical protein
VAAKNSRATFEVVNCRAFGTTIIFDRISLVFI